MKRDKSVTPRNQTDRVIYPTNDAAWDRLLCRLAELEPDYEGGEMAETAGRFGALQEEGQLPRHSYFSAEQMLMELRAELSRLEIAISSEKLPS